MGEGTKKKKNLNPAQQQKHTAAAAAGGGGDFFGNFVPCPADFSDVKTPYPLSGFFGRNNTVPPLRRNKKKIGSIF